MTQIVSNRLKTPDGTILVSRHRHDHVTHLDRITGKRYGVDGGLDYCRYTGDVEECEKFVLTTDDSFELIRSSFEWGTYGVNGDMPLHHYTLMHMGDTHIEAVLKTQTHIQDWVRKLFERELFHRKSQKITVKSRVIKQSPNAE